MRVVVIGAGPVGLEAAALASAGGHEVVVYDEGKVGAGVRTWSALRAWSPWRDWTGPAGRALLGEGPAEPEARPTGEDLLRRWLEPLAARLDVRPLTRVLGVARGPRGAAVRAARFRVVTEHVSGERGFDEADAVLDAGGAGDWLPIGPDGLPVPSENRAASAGRLRYGPVDPADLPPGPVLVAGDDPAALPQLAVLVGAGREVHHATALGGAGAGWTVHPPIERFGRSAEGITVFTSAGRLHAAQVVGLAGRRPDLGYARELQLSWSADEVPGGEPGFVACGQRAAGRVALAVADALAALPARLAEVGLT